MRIPLGAAALAAPALLLVAGPAYAAGPVETEPRTSVLGGVGDREDVETEPRTPAPTGRGDVETEPRGGAAQG